MRRFERADGIAFEIEQEDEAKEPLRGREAIMKMLGRDGQLLQIDILSEKQLETQVLMFRRQGIEEK